MEELLTIPVEDEGLWASVDGDGDGSHSGDSVQHRSFVSGGNADVTSDREPPRLEAVAVFTLEVRLQQIMP